MSDKEQPNVIPITNERLMSLDAFRGFIMFWIVGGEALVYALSKLDLTVPLDDKLIAPEYSFALAEIPLEGLVSKESFGSIRKSLPPLEVFIP